MLSSLFTSRSLYIKGMDEIQTWFKGLLSAAKNKTYKKNILSWKLILFKPFVSWSIVVDPHGITRIKSFDAIQILVHTSKKFIVEAGWITQCFLICFLVFVQPSETHLFNLLSLYYSFWLRNQSNRSGSIH